MTSVEEENRACLLFSIFNIVHCREMQGAVCYLVWLGNKKEKTRKKRPQQQTNKLDLSCFKAHMGMGESGSVSGLSIKLSVEMQCAYCL